MLDYSLRSPLTSVKKQGIVYLNSKIVVRWTMLDLSLTLVTHNLEIFLLGAFLWHILPDAPFS